MDMPKELKKLREKINWISERSQKVKIRIYRNKFDEKYILVDTYKNHLGQWLQLGWQNLQGTIVPEPQEDEIEKEWEMPVEIYEAIIERPRILEKACAGRQTSPQKAKTSRENEKKGGRPKINPPIA